MEFGSSQFRVILGHRFDVWLSLLSSTTSDERHGVRSCMLKLQRCQDMFRVGRGSQIWATFDALSNTAGGAARLALLRKCVLCVRYISWYLVADGWLGRVL
jgi:hypothetical protein